jgi:antibiotic biosynthesis monooxygenase (ABM) superfamily enzyme
MNSDLATAVITHRLGEDKHVADERWLEEVETLCGSMPVRRDRQVVRLVAGLTDTSAVMIRFDTQDQLRQWLESPVRHRRIQRLQPLFSGQDSSDISGGLHPGHPLTMLVVTGLVVFLMVYVVMPRCTG